MTAPIRPGFAPAPPITPQRSPAALAAQRAFFQAALDRAGAPSTPAPTAQAAPPAPQATTVAGAGIEPAVDSLPRPGRFLDIRV